MVRGPSTTVPRSLGRDPAVPRPWSRGSRPWSAVPRSSLGPDRRHQLCFCRRYRVSSAYGPTTGAHNPRSGAAGQPTRRPAPASDRGDAVSGSPARHRTAPRCTAPRSTACPVAAVLISGKTDVTVSQREVRNNESSPPHPITINKWRMVAAAARAAHEERGSSPAIRPARDHGTDGGGVFWAR